MAIVEGLAELTVKLHRLKDVAKPEQKVEALMHGGAVVEREAKKRAPVDSGNLRGSIKAEPVGEEVHIRPHTDYSGFVEFGTRYQAAQPYMRPAFDENIARIRGMIVYHLVRLIGKKAK